MLAECPTNFMLTFKDIEAAAARLDNVVHHTPVMTSRTLNERAGCRVFLKCECFQRSGSFKFRGAYNSLSLHLALQEYAKSSQNPDQPRNPLDLRNRGVITHSSGNHAQALALAGRLLEVGVLVVMPRDAPQVKIEATRGYGADIHFYDPATEDRMDVTASLQREQGRLLIPPFDDPAIIAGQGTAALEMCTQMEEPPDVVLAPCGGGGLLSGTALAVRYLYPRARIIGVEPEGADNGNRAFRSGKLERVENPRSMADGLKPKSLGEHTLAVIRAHVDEMVTVSEEEIRAALAFLWQRMKLLVEPSGAVALAAVLNGQLAAGSPCVGVILSGGNADVGAVADWLRAPSAGSGG